ncbi:hypothetical protein [Pseudoduganella namucuonensis]|uniref:Glycine zipper domain-containing protein n=1 Tax=Pseudoduganella namucuonensis TaxID=1035707 RepID=A0A1I7FL51_9BURK|nr:hypothetical protein [Pseudoduganella namucuonensis]SFU36894.1 hypothetical protein SAMN05216552_1002121 [Pseudoduganella namucuonensis]
MKRTISTAVAAALLASGCAAPDGDGRQNTSDSGGSQGQNAAAGAALGAVAGCALAKIAGKKCAEGAVIGAALGAAIGWSTYSEKVASAQTVNAEAQREGLKVPQNEIRLKDYQVYSTASVARAGGEPVQVVGNIKLYGQGGRVPEVVQSMTLLKANGEKASDKPQIARVERVDGAGQFRAVGVYKIPRGMEQGQYTVQSVLLLDGREVARRTTLFQVAGVPGPALAAR